MSARAGTLIPKWEPRSSGSTKVRPAEAAIKAPTCRCKTPSRQALLQIAEKAGKLGIPGVGNKPRSGK
jgi:hypothetical protein